MYNTRLIIIVLAILIVVIGGIVLKGQQSSTGKLDANIASALPTMSPSSLEATCLPSDATACPDDMPIAPEPSESLPILPE
jgi:hypothetical protein